MVKMVTQFSVWDSANSSRKLRYDDIRFVVNPVFLFDRDRDAGAQRELTR